ncbi:MAG: hypothetical protein M3I19_00860 [Lancefieldella parvula]|uniref:Uncharacterized protein n=1 Tax=Lancefieldella parvula TaxID=1382 RepID=A0A9E7ACU2_9ACTN|nr:MAG: hypothetical protein M3I19_00860 [Lancefieldella parvula]
MKAFGNFDKVVASNGGGSSMLEPGGYVAKIVRVKDHTEEKKPYLEFVYDIWNGETKSFLFTADLADTTNDWRHSFRLYFTGDFGKQRYKALTEAVENTAQGKGAKAFVYEDKDGAEQTLVGKLLGVVIRHRSYVNSEGKVKTAVDVNAFIPGKDAAEGNFDAKFAEPYEADGVAEARGNAANAVIDAPAPAIELADEDLPF